jgi:hypothetical protein
MKKRRKECYKEIEEERERVRKTDRQKNRHMLYLDIALGCNDSIHRCLSKRVKCFVKPSHEQRRKECYKEIERQTDRKTDRQMLYLDIALSCNDSIHRCLSKRVKPPHD